MNATIYYLTGTGNSLWVARTLAQELGDTHLSSIGDWKKGGKGIDSKVIGLVFPVHIWGVPPRVLQFVKELKPLQPAYIFAIAVNAGQVANTLVQLKKVLNKDDKDLSAGFEIPMPSNYIPWGGPGPREKQNLRFETAKKKISRIAAAINQRKEGPIEKGALWQRILLSLFYKMSLPYLPKMDRKFWADGKCNSCSICTQICPAENIILNNGKPTWTHQCEQCFACLQWCPQEAIQYGKRTPRYERYHHPEVQVKDVLRTKLSPS